MMEHRGIWEPCDDVHHIWGGQGRRLDVRSNLVGVNSEGHHERHHGTRGLQNEFTTLCLIAKLAMSKRMGDTLEFHYADLQNACGHPILCYIDSVSFADEWLETERKKLESLIRSMECE